MRVASLGQLRLESFSIDLMVDLLAGAGIDPSPALGRCGIAASALREPGFGVSGLQELNFQREFVALTGERRDLWEKLALRYRVPSISPWGFALATAPSVRRLFELIVEFADISYSLVRATSFIESPTVDGLQLDFEEIPEDLREFTMYRDTIGLTNLLHDDIWRGIFPFVRIETQLSRLQAGHFDFRAPVHFGARRSAWLWPAHLADSEPVMADGTLHDSYLRKARATLVDAPPGDPLLDRLRHALISAGKPLSLSELAERLHTSERSLQRRLARSGKSLREIVSEHRRQDAERLLSRSPDPIGTIAMKLGYSDQATFNHAFKRWTGLTPSAYRREQWSRAGSG